MVSFAKEKYMYYRKQKGPINVPLCAEIIRDEWKHRRVPALMMAMKIGVGKEREGRKSEQKAIKVYQKYVWDM